VIAVHRLEHERHALASASRAAVQRGRFPVKARHFSVLTAFSLGLLCLGSANAARAASVAGAAVHYTEDGDVVLLQVAATSGPNGAHGSFHYSKTGADAFNIIASVVDVCVGQVDGSDAAVVVARVTQARGRDLPPDLYLTIGVHRSEDGDLIFVTVSDLDCEGVLDDFWGVFGSLVGIPGHFTVKS
jgi:hypothetical protein